MIVPVVRYRLVPVVSILGIGTNNFSRHIFRRRKRSMDRGRGLLHRRLEGYIVRRRCMGKNLTFVTLSRNTENVQQDVFKVMFRRDLFNNQDENFPIKVSNLPYGALIAVEVFQLGDNQDDPPVVWSWNMINDNPRLRALEQAQQVGGGFSCSKYLKVRADTYALFHGDIPPQSIVSTRETTPKMQSDGNIRGDGDGFLGHGDPKYRGLRTKLFAQWLVDTLLTGGNAENDEQQPLARQRVLDIAGGRGVLSMKLASLGISCTVVDPMIRSDRSLKRLKQSQATVGHGDSVFLARRFGKDDESDALVRQYTCLVGFHPDEATEDILDMALKHNKMVAIVPCCVFPSFFPGRKLRNGKYVNSYEDFVEYLLQKDCRLRLTTLPFEGKNKVVYLALAPSAKSQPFL